MTLYLEDGTIEDAVRIIDKILDQLAEGRETARNLDDVGGFGHCALASQLEEGFRKKGREAQLYVNLLTQAVEALREAYLSGGAAFEDADNQFFAALAALHGDLRAV